MCNWVRVEDGLPEREQTNKLRSAAVFVYSSIFGAYSGHYNYEVGRWEAHAQYLYLEVEGVTHWATITPPGEES